MDSMVRESSGLPVADSDNLVSSSITRRRPVCDKEKITPCVGT